METSVKKKEKPSYSRQSSAGSPSSQQQATPSTSNVSAHSQALFLQKVRESNEAVNSGDFRRAIKAYTEAITLDPTNPVLYTNRSTAFAKLNQFQKSLLDARKARELNPKWAKAYIREGTALQQLGQHADALAAFASGLANDTNNAQLLNGLTESVLKSPLQEKLEPIFSQLQKLKLDKSPFVIISVIGQELLQAGHYNASIQMLESALKIGSCSLKLRGSVFSALSSAYWGMGNIDKAITYMQKDLQVAKQLGDQEGECRAYGNLGSAFFSKGHYKEALSHNRFQLVLAMRLKDRTTATVALTSLGHVYTAIGDYPNALQSHKQCSLLLKQSNEKLAEAREIGNVGAVYLAMGNFESAVECHLEHLKIAKSLKNNVEEARAFSNLGSAYHYKRNYEKAIVYHKQVLKIGEQRGDKALEARAYAGLGHAARCTHDYNSAKTYHEKQLDNALQTRDKVAEGRSCSNLGIIYHQLAEFEPALKLHKVHLEIAKDLGDRASQGRAFGNIGNAYSVLNQYEQAIKFHKQELAISTEVNDRHSEGSTHGNLAVAYQALKMFDSAHQHYVAHLNISRELKDMSSEARAVCNLGNFHSSRGEYTNSIPYYEQYLMLSQDLHDSEGEAKACFCLGYAHFALGNYPESVRYYEQDLSIAKELKNQLGIARSYCNLGLAEKALNNFKEALECQKKCLNLMTVLKNVKGRFRSMGNIGDILLKTGETSKAIEYYNQQLQLAKQCNSRDLLAAANGALGSAHRTLGQHDKALGFHTQELSIRQDMNDLKGECRAHGNLGNVYMALGKYMNAFKCYEEQLEKSRELQSSSIEANACGNLAITKMNMGNFEEAIGLFEQQLAMLAQIHGNTATFDKGRAFGNLGDCYEALGDCEESIKCHEQYLIIAQNATSLSDQDKAYRGLGNAHRSVGNLQQALVCFEKRLVVAHELNSSAAKASAYGELGCLHSLLGNFEQAISCLQHQLSIAREMEDRLCEGEAACGLGGVYQQMGEYDKALQYHEMDLKISESTQNTACQCRAYGNLGLSHESLGEFSKAIHYQEQHLTIAAQMNDRVAKTLAYSSLGRVHHALNNHPQAVEYLRQGLQIAEQLGRMEDEAKIRHRLGLALWGKGDFEECQQQLYKASELFESIRRDAQFNSEYKLSLFDLQTACYQALQRVLVTLDRHNEALVVAERACTRAFIDLLMERQAGSEGFFGNHVTDPHPITTDQITSMVAKQNSLVLCFSVAAGFLYSWLLTPKDGIVKFHETSMADVESETDSTADTVSLKSTVSFSSCSLLDSYVGHIRESMGVESHAPSSGLRLASRSISLDAAVDSDSEDMWEHHLEELGDKLNAENDRTGFLRIVNRNHLFNSSNYSLGSLFSVSASLNGCSASFPGAGISRKNSVRNKLGNKSASSALYHLLIEPFEDEIEMASDEMGPGTPNLIIVLQGDLFLIPFSVLRRDQTMEYLFERFNLLVVPSLTSLQSVNKHDKHGRPVIDSSGAVVVGNPKLTPAICQHWHLHDIPTAEYEARIVGEILTARPLIGQEATKGMVLSQIEQVEVIHFAAHISWKLSSVILSPGEVPPHPARFPTIDSDDSSSDISSFDGPSLSEYLLTAADILNLKLRTKLVVLSAGYTDDRAGRINSDGVVGLTRSLLSAGAQCVLYCLWPVPDQASKLLMKTLYVDLQEGKPVSKALSHAIKMVQSTKQFSHPSNWGGWVLMGQDVKLSSKVALMGHALCELLKNPAQCKESMRVLLHLIEKSLQRIHQGTKNSMYTTSQSIENKVGGLSGWKDLLQAVGFRFEPSTNGLPPAVFFPQSDPAERLTQASASLQALLGLPHGSFVALSKFLTNYEAGEAMIRVMRDILSKMAAKETNVDVKVGVKVWRVTGCHEFLAALSMDLVEVGNDEITLRLGKQSNKRHLQFALQSLVSLFNTQEAPRSLVLDSSSSLESLSSSHSGSTSTSNFSKGSTPPMSPRNKKKSFFDPAEMEKMRIANRMNRMSQGGLSGRKLPTPKSSKKNINDPSLCLSYQNQIKTMYPPGTSRSQDGGDVCVTALSDSDTPLSETASPDPGSSNTSDKLRGMGEVEQLDWSNEQLDIGNDTDSLNSSCDKNRTLEHGLSRSRTVDENSENVMKKENESKIEQQIEHNEKTGPNGEREQNNANNRELIFDRNGVNRNSDTSNASSVSQGKFDRDSGIRHSDTSDLSMEGEGRLTPKNQLDLELYLQQIDENNVHQLSGESGIVSESASSNISEGSQQSDQSDFKFDPSEIARKVMSEVSAHKKAIDSLQKTSMVKSQIESNSLRSEYQNQTKSLSSPTKSNIQNMPDSKLSAIATDLGVRSETSVQSQVSGTDSANSAFTSPTHTAKIPPPVAAKPTFQSNPAAFRNLSTNMSNLALSLSSGNTENTLDKTDGDETHPPLEITKGKELKCALATTTAITVNKKDSFSSSTSASTSMSFSSFRPSNKTNTVEGDNQGRGSLYRPDSATSTSSYCSTPSSVQSVIYKPIIKEKENESPNVTTYDSSSEQTSNSGSADTMTPTINLSEIPQTGSNKRDSSPALSTGSSTSSKSGKPKKKVSFSDSDPSDTPSPLNLSGNQSSYFDINKGLGQFNARNLPSWAYGSEPNLRNPPSHLSGLKQVLGLKDPHLKSRTKVPSPPVKYSLENVPKSPRDFLPKNAQNLTLANLQMSDHNSSLDSITNSSLSSPRESVSSVNSASMSSLNSPMSPGSVVSQHSPSLPTEMKPQGAPGFPSQRPATQQNQRPHYAQPPPYYGQPPPPYKQAVQKNPPPTNLPLSSPKHQVPSSLTPQMPPSHAFPPSSVAMTTSNNFPPPPSTFGGPSANVTRAPMKSLPDPSQNYQDYPNRYQLDSSQGYRVQSQSQGQGYSGQTQLQGQSSPGHSQGHYQRQLSQEYPGQLVQSQYNLENQPIRSLDGKYTIHPKRPVNLGQNVDPKGQPFSQVQGQVNTQGRYGTNPAMHESSPSRQVSSFGDHMSYNPPRDHQLSQGPGSRQGLTNGYPEQLEMRSFQRDPISRAPNYGSPNFSNGPSRRPPVPPARIDSWENMDRKLNPPLSPDQPLSKSYPLLASQNMSPKHNLMMNQAISQSQQRVPQSPERGLNNNWGHYPSSQGTTSQNPAGGVRGNIYNENFTSNRTKVPNGSANIEHFQNGNIPNQRTSGDYSANNKIVNNYSPANNNATTSNQPTNNNMTSSYQLALSNNQVLPTGGLRRVNLGNDKKSFSRTSVIQPSKC